MNAISLFKIQSLVALTLVTLSLPVLGQTTTPAAKPAAAAAPKPAETATSTQSTAVRSSLDSYLEACPDGQTTSKCKELYMLAGGSSATTTDSCSTQTTRADDLQQKNNEAGMNLLTSQKEMMTAARSARDAIVAAQLKQAEATRVYADTQRKLMLDRQAKEDAAGIAGKKAVTELRRKADETANALLEASKELQAAELAVTSADITKEATCRTDADKAGSEVQAKIDGDRAAAKAGKVLYNWSLTSLASSDNRRAAKRKADIQLAYITAYKGCIDGGKGSGPGLAGAMKVAEAQLAQARTNYAAKLEILKTARARVDEDMATLGDEVAAKARDIVRAYEDGMASALSAFNNIMDSTTATITNLKADMEEDKSFNQTILSKTADQNQQLMASMTNAFAAVQKCNADQAPKAADPDSAFDGKVERKIPGPGAPVAAPAPAVKSVR